MQICKLTIISIVDGVETKSVHMGGIERKNEEIFLRYKEESSDVGIQFSANFAKIERRGEYALSLHLSKENSVGRLYVGGSEGELFVKTEEVVYTQGEDFFEGNLHYRLLFGEESQDMQLKIYARTRVTK